MHIRYACGDIRFGREVAVKEGTLGEMESSGKSNCSLMRKSRYWPTGANTDRTGWLAEEMACRGRL